MRLLVTGASGFIGSQVLEQLAGGPVTVHAVARTPARDLPATWHAADLLDAAARAAVVATVEPTHLLHLAWVTEHGVFWESPRNHDWAEATIYLLEEFAAAGGRRAVVAGSCAEYDWSDPGLVTGTCHETATPLGAASLYGRVRAETFRRATQLAASSGLSLAWARLFFLFGPRENPRRLVPSLIRAALTAETLELTHPDRIVDLISTFDAATALIRILESEVAGPVNVASGQGVRLAALAAQINQIAGRPSMPESSAAPPDVRLVADVTRLSTEVGFEPKYDLEAALEEAISWWRHHPRWSDDTVE